MTFLAIPFPMIDPVLIELGPLQIRWYALAYIAGILLAWHYAKYMARQARFWPGGKSPMTDADLDDFVLWATLGIILGGRLGYVLFYNLDAYLADPAEILAVWNGGMAFHGGFLGVTVAMILFARARSLSLLSMFDIIAMAAPFGLFFGRIANFINSELWGRITEAPWGVIFPNGGPLPRHPSQLYEAALEGVVLFVLLFIVVRVTNILQRPGTVSGIFVIFYGLFRSLVELVRVPDEQIGYLPFGTTMGMWLSLPMILAGLAVILYAHKKAKA